MTSKKLIKYYVVDAFTDSAFKGNPAAVCLLEEEREEEWLQAVASEFNISQTCFLRRLAAESGSNDSPHGNLNPRFKLRWFAPNAEMDLCGHATLAAAHTLFSRGLVSSNLIEFNTLSGVLTAKKVEDVKAIQVFESQNGGITHENYFIELNLPVVPTTDFNCTDSSFIHKALNVPTSIDMKITTTSGDILVILPSAEYVTNLQPRSEEIEKCPGRAIIVSGAAASETGFDFYSRIFAPKLRIKEDPVCGSAHCALAPYWSQKLGKCDFIAYVASPRGGILGIHLDEKNQRVLLRGKAVNVKKVLQKVHGVHSINIDANEGTVAISSSVDPLLFIKMLAKAGKKAELLWESKQMPKQDERRTRSSPSPPPTQPPPPSAAAAADARDSTGIIDHFQLWELAKIPGLKHIEVEQPKYIKLTFKESNNNPDINRRDHVMRNVVSGCSSSSMRSGVEERQMPMPSSGRSPGPGSYDRRGLTRGETSNPYCEDETCSTM